MFNFRSGPSTGLLNQMLAMPGPRPGAATIPEKSPRFREASDGRRLATAPAGFRGPSGSLLPDVSRSPSACLWLAVLEQALGDLQATQHPREALEARAFLTSEEGRNLVGFFGGSRLALTKLLQSTPIPAKPEGRIKRRKG